MLNGGSLEGRILSAQNPPQAWVLRVGDRAKGRDYPVPNLLIIFGSDEGQDITEYAVMLAAKTEQERARNLSSIRRLRAMQSARVSSF